jgi:replication factor C subunit 2/4
MNHIPWIEKYRPKTINDLILSDVASIKIRNIIQSKDMPNIIITGIPGIGKTTTIKCIANSLYGKNINNAVLEINASDERGIKAVQDTIMNFCKKQIETKEGQSIHKIIILDEADNMTTKAQGLINNLIEKYSATTRFALTCNNSEDIIESIQSRSTVLKYSRISKKDIIKRLEYICDEEKVKYEKGTLEILAFISNGDIRNAINNLQLVNNCFEEITEKNIYIICDKPQPYVIENIFKACVNKDLKTAIEIVLSLKDKGYSESDIILNMIQFLRTEKTSLNEKQKIEYMKQISMTAYIMSKGLDTMIQLTSCISKLTKT